MAPQKKKAKAEPAGQARFSGLKVVVLGAEALQKKLWIEKIGSRQFGALSRSEVEAGKLRDHGDATHVVSCFKDWELVETCLESVGAEVRLVLSLIHI